MASVSSVGPRPVARSRIKAEIVRFPIVTGLKTSRTSSAGEPATIAVCDAMILLEMSSAPMPAARAEAVRTIAPLVSMVASRPAAIARPIVIARPTASSARMTAMPPRGDADGCLLLGPRRMAEVGSGNVDFSMASIGLKSAWREWKAPAAPYLRRR